MCVQLKLKSQCLRDLNIRSCTEVIDLSVLIVFFSLQWLLIVFLSCACSPDAALSGGGGGLGEEGGGVWGRQGRGLGEAGERTGGEKKTAKFLSAASTFFGGLRAVFSE